MKNLRSYSLVLVTSISLLVLSCNNNKESEAVVSTEPPKEITAIKLLADYEADEPGSNKIYEGRTLIISGEVMSIKPNPDGSTVILLNSPHSSIGSVRCHFTAEESAAVSLLKRTDNTIIKGVCTGMDTHIQVVVDNCKIFTEEAVAASFTGKPKDHPNNIKALDAIMNEEGHLSSFISDAGILYTSVVSEGKKMDGYAKRLRDILQKNKSTVKWVKVIEYDTADPSNPDNSFGILLAETRW